MRATIRGRLYDTRTGTYICQTNRGKLYRKYHATEFFLLARDKIMPLKWSEAKSLCFHFAPANTYKDYFTTQIIDQKVRTNIDLSRIDMQKLKILSGTHDLTPKQMLHKIICDEYGKLDRHIRDGLP